MFNQIPKEIKEKDIDMYNYTMYFAHGKGQVVSIVKYGFHTHTKKFFHIVPHYQKDFNL